MLGNHGKAIKIQTGFKNHGSYEMTIYILGDKPRNGKMGELTQEHLGLIGGCTFHVKKNTGKGRFSAFHASQSQFQR